MYVKLLIAKNKIYSILPADNEKGKAMRDDSGFQSEVIGKLKSA